MLINPGVFDKKIENIKYELKKDANEFEKKAGQEVMPKAIKNPAQKHVKTGSMANSVKCLKPVINHNGDVVGRSKFYDKDKNGEDDIVVMSIEAFEKGKNY